MYCNTRYADTTCKRYSFAGCDMTGWLVNADGIAWLFCVNLFGWSCGSRRLIWDLNQLQINEYTAWHDIDFGFPILASQREVGAVLIMISGGILKRRHVFTNYSKYMQNQMLC